MMKVYIASFTKALTLHGTLLDATDHAEQSLGGVWTSVVSVSSTNLSLNLNWFSSIFL